MRLQKLFSQLGIASRRETEAWIESGRITVNNKPVRLGQIIKATDIIQLDDKRIKTDVRPPSVVIAFYKPIGVECTLQKIQESVTLADIDFGSRVFPIGRLDKNSEGLLLLTNDGDLSQKIIHPSFHHEKEYHAILDKPVSDIVIEKLKRGVIIDNKKIIPTKILRKKHSDKKNISIIIKEGRNRQIHRMFGAFDLTVRKLKRIRIGGFELGNMTSQQWRYLTQEEIQTIFTDNKEEETKNFG